MTMTLATFRASGRDVVNLGEEHPGLDLEGIAGRIYAHEAGPYIERHGGEFSLIIGNQEWVGVMANLPKLEILLYDWARAEGVI